MIIALAVFAGFWMLFGRKALAWAIVIGAVIFAITVFLAPPIKVPPSCQEDWTAVPVKLCPPIGDRL